MKKVVRILLLGSVVFNAHICVQINAAVAAENPFKKLVRVGQEFLAARRKKNRQQESKDIAEKEKKKCLQDLNTGFPEAREHFSFAFTTYLKEILEPDIEAHLSQAGLSSVSFDQEEEEEEEHGGDVIMPSARDLKDCTKKRMESLNKWYTQTTHEEFDSSKGPELGGVHHMYRIIRYMIQDPENRFTRSTVIYLRETTRKKAK